MKTLPVTLLYNPLTERFCCPNVEHHFLAERYSGVYKECFVSQFNYSDGTIGTNTWHQRHNFAKTVAVWKVKPATGSIEDRLNARKGIAPVSNSKVLSASLESFNFN